MPFFGAGGNTILMRLKIEGPNLHELDFTKAL